MCNIFLLYTLHFTLYTAAAQSISSAELITRAKELDGQVVIYEGEVVGDVMVRGNYAWVNVHDGANAIGVWVPAELARAVGFTAGYVSKGDWIELEGVFSKACPEHGGDLDIHARQMRVLRPGRPVTERLNIGKRNLAFILAGVVCLVLILRQLK